MRAYRHLVEGRRVDGMVLARTRVSDERIEWLQARQVHFVTHGRTGAACPHAWVDVDGAAAFDAATQRLAVAGHVRIALLNAPPRYFFATDRAAGWRAALAACRLQPSAVREAEPIEDNGYQPTRALLRGPAPPTALLCATDRLAVGALHAIADSGLRRRARCLGDRLRRPAGRRLGPAGLDHLHASIPKRRRRVVELLLRLLAGEDAAALNVLLQARLVVRNSDGPAPVTRMPNPVEAPCDTKREFPRRSLLLGATAVLAGAGQANAQAPAGNTVFLSTQLRPLEEAQKVREVILKGYPGKVDYVADEPAAFTVRVEAELKAGHAHLSLLGALHGELQPLVPFGALAAARRPGGEAEGPRHSRRR